MNMVDSFEKIPVEIYKTPDLGSLAVAKEISELIRAKDAKNEKCVLGLATGSTPIQLYAVLVCMLREEGLSFKNVLTFILDEYYPISRGSINSYWTFMHQHLFDHVDIAAENIHIPNGELPKA